jgi:hypothetical protein
MLLRDINNQEIASRSPHMLLRNLNNQESLLGVHCENTCPHRRIHVTVILSRF